MRLGTLFMYFCIEFLYKIIKSMLEKEFQYYLQHQEELVLKYNNRFIVIVGQRVVGDYDTFADAVSESQKKYSQGTFLVQRCSEGNKDYSFTYHSRVRTPHATKL